METATLHATKRQELGTHAMRRLRREGLLPAVLYGHRRDTVPLSVPLTEIQRAIAAGTRMVSLDIGGVQEMALLKEIQHDSLGDELLHVDLARVAMDEKVTVRVPVELHGLAKGAASGGTLDHLVQDIEVTCFPQDIPEKIRVEVAHLDVGQMVCVRDLQPPAGVQFRLDPEIPVAIVHAPVAAKEPAPAEAPVLPTEPELIGRRAAEEGEEEGEE
ncbi:MAG TPA: 50S ribosomal protein L25 [Planctomycetota bacterium]|nr:50S ribosomal protein L25 [Planctomycetota bacterium]